MATVEDRRTVRSDVVPDLDAIFGDEEAPESVDATTDFEVEDSYEGPEGFVEGESVWVPELSTEFEHVFANPDGTVTVLHTTTPAEVAEDGFTLDFDPTEDLVRRPNGRFGTSGADVEVTVPEVARAGEVLATLDVAGDVLSVRPDRENSAGEGAPSGPNRRGPSLPSQAQVPGQLERERPGEVRFDDVVGDVDVVVTALRDGVKFDYVIESAADAEGLLETIDLPEGWSVRQLDGLIEILDEGGERAGLWSGGAATDSGENESDAAPALVTVELVESDKSSATARLVVDQDWLNDPNTVYPVLLDPVVTVGQGVTQDIWIGPDATGPVSSPELQLGTLSGNERQSYLEFALIFGSEFAEGPTVASADLYLTVSYTGGVRKSDVERTPAYRGVGSGHDSVEQPPGEHLG